jgi:predicted transcriptional regulator
MDTIVNQIRNIFVQKEVLKIKNPKTILMINNAKKRVILELLMNQEKTIMQLSRETGWNPGTVKRHISDLNDGKLVEISRIEFNKHHTKSIYYRASAKRFKFTYVWPPSSSYSEEI